MNCYKCKHPNLHGSNFCEKCGADLKAPPPPVVNPLPRTQYGGNYGSRYGQPADYPPSRPSPAPRPTPAPRPSPAGSGYSPPAPTPAPAQPTPPKPVAPPPRPAAQEPPQRRRSPVISGSNAPTPGAPAAPSARPEPLPFAHLKGAKGGDFALRYDENLVGRASPGEGIEPQVDLTTIDTTGTVSRRHAKIGKDDSSIFIEDLGSSNGTRLNGQSLRPGMQSPLTDGDQLIFGDVVFTIQIITPR